MALLLDQHIVNCDIPIVGRSDVLSVRKICGLEHIRLPLEGSSQAERHDTVDMICERFDVLADMLAELAEPVIVPPPCHPGHTNPGVIASVLLAVVVNRRATSAKLFRSTLVPSAFDCSSDNPDLSYRAMIDQFRLDKQLFDRGVSVVMVGGYTDSLPDRNRLAVGVDLLSQAGVTVHPFMF